MLLRLVVKSKDKSPLKNNHADAGIGTGATVNDVNENPHCVQPLVSSIIQKRPPLPLSIERADVFVISGKTSILPFERRSGLESAKSIRSIWKKFSDNPPGRTTPSPFRVVIYLSP